MSTELLRGKPTGLMDRVDEHPVSPRFVDSVSQAAFPAECLRQRSFSATFAI